MKTSSKSSSTRSKGNSGKRGVMVAVAIMAVAGFVATPTLANAVQEIGSSVITNNSSENALSIIQGSDVGRSRSSSGAIHLDNTGNDNTGLTLYSNAGGTASQPLARLEVDNPSWNEEILYIHSDSPTSRGLIRLDSPAPEIEFVETDQSGGGKGKFEIRVQHNEFQFNSRRADDTTFENKINMTQEGDLVFEHGTLNVKSNKAAQFSGGLNVTGGCIAIDGECVITSAGDVKGAVTTQSADTSSSSAGTIGGAALSDGKPREIECNSYTERGALVLDYTNNLLYICNGPERGWDHVSLTN